MVDTKEIEPRDRKTADGKRGHREHKYFDTKMYRRYQKLDRWRAIYRELIKFSSTQGKESIRENKVSSAKRCFLLIMRTLMYI